MPFVKGESGNPAGRPPGARNTRTLLCEAFLDNQAEGLTRTLVNLANGGDSTALRLAIDRILPRGASRPILFELPRVDSAAAARRAVADVIQATATAQLAPREASELLRVIDRGAKIIATAEAAEAVAREGQPRQVEVTWVEPEDMDVKWKQYWKERYEELYGALPDLPDPEEGGWLPPVKAPAVDKAGASAEEAGAPPDPEPGLSSATESVSRDGIRNNENNENNEATAKDPEPPLMPGRSRPRRERRAKAVATSARARGPKRRPRSRPGRGSPRGQAGSSA